jgi:glycosyltransferase involved in cell wall biosynthesis
MATAMRILAVTNDLEVGGVQTYLLHLTRALVARGHEVAVALVTGDGALASTAGVPVERFPFIGRRGPLKWPRPQAVAQLSGFIDRFGPDLVHTHLFWGNTVGRLAALQSRLKPLVLATEHSTYHHKPRWAQQVDRWLALRCGPVMAVSDTVAEFTRRQERLPADLVWTVPLGLGPELPTASAELPDPWPDRQVVGVVARLHPDKQLDWFLRVLSRLTARRREVLGVLVGDGPDRVRLEQLAHRLGLDSAHCQFLGPRHPVLPYLRHFDVFLLPSRREGFGLAPLEAMAAGVPVVLSDLPAFRELTNRGKYGTLVPLPPFSGLDTWVEAVEEALRHPPDPVAVKAWVSHRYSWERHVDRLVEVYRALLQQRSKTC